MCPQEAGGGHRSKADPMPQRGKKAGLFLLKQKRWSQVIIYWRIGLPFHVAKESLEDLVFFPSSAQLDRHIC